MSQELIQITCCLGFCIFVPSLAFLYFWSQYLRPANQLNKQAASVAETLGWHSIIEHRQVWFKMYWYQTKLDDGRRVAFASIMLPRGYRTYGVGAGMSAVSAVRIAVEVLIDEPLDVVGYSQWVEPDHIDSFEQVFEGTHLENIPHGTRGAMLEFTRQQGSKLRLRDRATAKTAMFPRGVLDEASVLVAHEYRISQPTAETIREKTAALIKIAHTLEEQASS